MMLKVRFQKRVDQQSNYSKHLKSERSDFGAFQSCPIPKQFGFQTVSEIQTILFGFQTLTKRWNRLNRLNSLNV